MNNARRNRILFWSYTAVCVVLSGALVAVMFFFSDNRPWRPALLAAGVAGLWVWQIWSAARESRSLRKLERELEASGVSKPDEEPIPLRLAENRESLIASLVALALVAATFVASFRGWIG